MSNIRPKVIVSRCLGFDTCRYNGATIPDKFVEKLGAYVEYTTVCPEVEIGMGVPRDPIRLIQEQDNIFLYQPSTGSDFTKSMLAYSNETLSALEEFGEIDGFILKGKSPSCGIKDVKVYLGREKAVGSVKGAGVFATEVMDRFPHLAIEEEGRLTNFKIREHFLTRLYVMAKFREVEKSGNMQELVKFQSDNKYLLMTYHQKEQKVLGRIVANHEKLPFEQVLAAYKEHLGLAFMKMPKIGNFINALSHIYGYYSEELSVNEKAFILDTFERYKKSHIPLSVPLHILRTYAIKYGHTYLLDQTIWEPFPEELMDISDTGKTEN